jgi:hypothetical protein
MRACTLVVSLILAGCAHEPSRSLGNRLTLGYTDHKLFAVMHYDAADGEAGSLTGLRGYAGRIVGRACGADVVYYAEYRGKEVWLDGFSKNLTSAASSTMQGADKPSHLEVRDHKTPKGVVRTIDGKIGGDDFPEFAAGVEGGLGILAARVMLTPRHHAVDLELTHERLTGRAGFRDFDLHAEGDTYFGTMKFSGYKLPFRVRGRGSLWSMPAADQAAILPFVLTCVRDERSLVQEIDLGYDR